MSSHHPNACIPKAYIESGLMAASNAFRSCGMESLRPPEDRFDCDSLLYGEMGDLRFIVYVRVTCDDDPDPEDDTPPGTLLNAANDIGAEPHLIDVHVSKSGEYNAFRYRGYQEFIRAVKAHESEWNRSLLKGKTVGDFLRLKGGELSELELVLEKKKDDEGEFVRLRLRIDGHEPYDGTICPYELLKSTARSDEYFIFTCSCGEPGCAGIFHGIIVVNEGNRTLWKAYHAKLRKIFVFDRQQYTSEILTKCELAIQSVRRGEVAGITPWEGRFEILERMFSEMNEEPSGDAFDESIMVWSKK
jgi:hypothetical protein